MDLSIFPKDVYYKSKATIRFIFDKDGPYALEIENKSNIQKCATIWDLESFYPDLKKHELTSKIKIGIDVVILYENVSFLRTNEYYKIPRYIYINKRKNDIFIVNVR